MLANAWRSVLPESHRVALDTALQWEIDIFFEEWHEIANEQLSFVDSSLGSKLPRRYALRYSTLFAKRFFTCFLSVGWKLAQRRRPAELLSCVAEELALHALIRQAEAHMEMDDIDYDFG